MMPKKDEKVKRSIMLGVKVNQETRAKIEYLANREGQTISTWIHQLIINEIKEYTRQTKTDWSKELTHEGGE